MAKEDIYIGLMSGTSADGLDIAAISCEQNPPKSLATQSVHYPKELRDKILALYTPGNDEIDRMGTLDNELGKFIGSAVNTFIDSNRLDKSSIRGVCSHGQTIRHRPTENFPFTLQIGDPNQIATITGLTVIADVRRKDMALGGQGAPLAPAFHHAAFSNFEVNRAVVNIGGIANITQLPSSNSIPVIGFDTGPGNGLMDEWIQSQKQLTFDEEGAWASQGECQQSILSNLLTDPYFSLSPPKSTGREYFTLDWVLQKIPNIDEFLPEDIQRTLLELTAKSIANCINQWDVKPGEIILCGGGVHNKLLVNELTEHMQEWKVTDSAELGIDPDYMEAIAFAWFGAQTLRGLTSSLKSVTGAKQNAVLGCIYPPP